MAHDLSLILDHFKIETTEKAMFHPITNGYINDTFLVTISSSKKYILQRINHNVFENYTILQDNINKAILHLDDNHYSKISFIATKNNASLATVNNSIWRLMTFIPDSQTFNTTTSSKIAFEAGKIIGTFHKLLINENVEHYKDVITDFHFLPLRKNQFYNALDTADDVDKNTAEHSLNFALEALPKFDDFYKAQLPVRICHNDTKLNNILFNKNNEALCLIDLDTIMKGYFHYDFGDAIRTIVNSVAEDEKDLSKINFNDLQFESFIKGLHISHLKLSKTELKFLPISAALMPFMHGLRALTDFLNKNKYYKVSYPEQNLDRSKSLFQFSKLALEKQHFMKSCIARYYH